ncbi:hypothetical protein CBU02nite_39150 [Clostridium butyricum]|jgi:RNase adaptor protein for sRNA GlmZ degradation|uniref:Uncharacterized protein n=1 Tax=Clostridium butyricum TaxID=1492 RepID=A0A512TT47_CLOBU|nr:hypothetical protein [Clostridium butyricum]NOW25236.1 RNase adaptor protein for sRNA GlmZ degradation [Clostridium butyricum]GEQ23409.1 hypothetical protein CBU02nite_39150 [Clostridium butyricum]
MNKKYYLIIVESGHVGAGKSIEISRYFEDFSLAAAYYSASNMPRSKKKSNSIKLVQEISYEQYCQGKLSENLNQYLQTVSIKIN